jgi:hypothetical protein
MMEVLAMADVAELSETTTPEEMKQMVDDIAAERKGDTPESKAEERADEQKSDAQIASEHAGKPNETPAETDSGSNDTAPEGEATVEVEDQDDEPGDESESQGWLDDDMKAEATAFGIGESELAEFASREELERALRLFDKSALEVGRKALAESDGEGEQARNEKGQFAKKEPTGQRPDPPKADPPEKRDGQYEFKMNIYDEDLEGDLKGLRDHYDSRLAALEERLLASDERLHASEARFAEAETRAKQQHFDNLVDSLGHADLFGKTDKETSKEKDRRQDLFVEVETYLRGREVLGRPAELNETVVNRIARSLFADELGKKDLKKRTRKISKQSNGRQGGGATRPQDPREDPRDEADRLYREMERA